MIISITYNLGDRSVSKYFDTYEESSLFIKKLQEVNNDEFLHFDFYVYSGDEELRVRKIIAEEKEKKQESEKICNNCEHIESCVEELYLRDNMPDKFVCDNFKLKQEKENE